MATELFRVGWPEEEAVCHLWRHLTFKDESGLTEEFIRAIVEAVYEEGRAQGGKRPQPEVKELLMQQVIRRIESRYVLRHNAIMGYTEYRSNHTWATPWRPVTEQVINTFTTDLQLAGLAVWDRDVKRYVHSTRVRDFNPIDDYLFRNNKWDGRDYIRELAATVPTENPEQWAEWFHTWFLAMVAQWLGRDRRYGNACRCSSRGRGCTRVLSAVRCCRPSCARGAIRTTSRWPRRRPYTWRCRRCCSSTSTSSTASRPRSSRAS